MPVLFHLSMAHYLTDIKAPYKGKNKYRLIRFSIMLAYVGLALCESGSSLVDLDPDEGIYPLYMLFSLFLFDLHYFGKK